MVIMLISDVMLSLIIKHFDYLILADYLAFHLKKEVVFLWAVVTSAFIILKIVYNDCFNCTQEAVKKQRSYN